MLKAVLFDFNGVIINDEAIHRDLIEDLLLQENLQPIAKDYWQCCLGRSDRACLRDLLTRRGRAVSEDYLSKLIVSKAQAYRQRLDSLPQIPLYPGLESFLVQLQSKAFYLGLVTGALRTEAEAILARVNLADYFQVIVGGDEVDQSKPQPDGYLRALERLNQQFPEAAIAASNCLVIEDTPAGILAGKRAGMQVVGVAHSYPFHFMQRQAHWAIDDFAELDLDRVEQTFALDLR
jgi:beta-phosphoglucomutase